MFCILEYVSHIQILNVNALLLAQVQDLSFIALLRQL